MNCEFDGCDRPHYAKGFCRAHYRQQGAKKEIRPHIRGTLAERLMARGKRDPDTGCLLWTGALLLSGYGAINDCRGRIRTVHRVAWEIEHGPVPEGLFVCHHCDVRSCFEIGHLFVGTPQDNSMDCVFKGRGVAILNRKQVDQILAGDESCTALAKRFLVSKDTIWRVRRGQNIARFTERLPMPSRSFRPKPKPAV